MISTIIKDDEEYQQKQEKLRQEFAEKLTNMHTQNLITQGKKKASMKKFEHETDRMAVDNGIRMADNSVLKRKKEILEQKRKNHESEKKTAMAAKGITREREIEKDKLTLISLNRGRQMEEH